MPDVARPARGRGGRRRRRPCSRATARRASPTPDWCSRTAGAPCRRHDDVPGDGPGPRRRARPPGGGGRGRAQHPPPRRPHRRQLLAVRGTRAAHRPSPRPCETVDDVGAPGCHLRRVHACVPRAASRDLEHRGARAVARTDDLDLPRDAELRALRARAHARQTRRCGSSRERILFTGDLCFFGVTPLAVQGLLSSGWIAALDDAHRPGTRRSSCPATARSATHGRHRRRALTTCRRYWRPRSGGRRRGSDPRRGACRAFDPGPVGEWVEAERSRRQPRAGHAGGAGRDQRAPTSRRHPAELRKAAPP